MSVYLLWFALALATPAQGPAEESLLRLEVRRLLHQLDAPTLAEREAAERKLIELGPRVLDYLPRDEQRWSAEVIQRSRRIRQVLQRQLADEALRPSTVTLRAESMRLSEVLAEIQRQTGNKINTTVLWPRPAAPDPELALSLSETPFWEALDRVLDDARMAAELFGAEKAIYVRPPQPGQAPRSSRAVYVGPFRIEPIRMEAVRDLRTPEQRVLRVVLEIAWEPRLQPVSLRRLGKSLEAVDDRGNRLAGPDSGEVEIPVIPTVLATEVPVLLKLPPREATQVARLRGGLAALVPGPVETFRFAELDEKARNVERRIGATTVTLERIRRNADLWELRVAVRFEQAGDALASHYNWILDSEAYLEASGQEPVQPAAMDTIRRSENEIGFSYLFAVDGALADYGFVYKTPIAILAREYEFELGELPLP
ncbi:MAG TPA: hypothetical protein EYH34_07655 [Planctomycetes bacterium]|nr:hypothetical protein [Planctomycetota bacterium]